MKKIILILITILSISNATEINPKQFQKENIEKCDKGDKKACYVLGDFAYSIKNIENAKKYYTIACEKNVAEACFSLSKISK